MGHLFNVYFDKQNFTIVQNDTWYKAYSVRKAGALYSIAGMQLDLEVKDDDGVTVLTLSSAGPSPTITISGSSYLINAPLAFPNIPESGKYHYDLQLTNAGVVSTICRGWIKVLPEFTD